MAQPYMGHSPMQPVNMEGGMWQQGQQDFGGRGTEGDFAGCAVSQVPPEIRSGFVRKVYSILSVQLLATFVIALYMNSQLTPLWVAEHHTFALIVTFGTLGLLLGVSCCCGEAMRTFPTNYIFLGAITIGMAFIVGFCTVQYSMNSVLLALATTAAVFFVLTAYACLTKTDFTGMGPYLVAGAAALFMFGTMLILWGYITGSPMLGGTMQKVYACGGVVLFVLYIIYDTQKIVGGSHKKHQFSVDDYAWAAVNLYLDIVYLFIHILELTGDGR